MKQTLFEKIWQRNLVVAETEERPGLLFVGLHLLHEITSPQAFSIIEEKGLTVRRPDLTLAVADHCTPSLKNSDGQYLFQDEKTANQIDAMTRYCQKFAVPCLDLDAEAQGIVHVIAPELGLSKPGSVIVCGDSHTSTHGAFGAIALGIGTSEVAQVLSSQCIMLRKPKNMRIVIEGYLRDGVSAKDLALYLINKMGANSCKGYAIEYQGSAIRNMTMEERLTICNMTIEAGSRFGLIAPDSTTFEYLAKTQYGANIQDSWQQLFSDDDADWDKSLHIDASEVSRMITWGTTPAMAIPLDQQDLPELNTPEERKAAQYMGLDHKFHGLQIQHVFIGSCTNGRLSDLEEAAKIFAGKQIPNHVSCLIVAGSKEVKRQAESKGLEKIFIAAGARWGEPGCSLCNAMNGDFIPPHQIAVSTSNRNFEGRQGPKARTILASPKTAAEIACRGVL